VRDAINQVIDTKVGDGLAELIDAHALASDVLGETQVARTRAQMEEAEARRLQPHYIRSFFIEAFGLLGGRMAERETGRFQIRHVPQDMRARDRQIGIGAPVLRSYERVCFDKDQARVPGRPMAELLAPGHPLLDVVLDITLERYRMVLTQGAVLIDDRADTVEPHVLVVLEHAIADGRPDGRSIRRRVVSRQMHFVDLCPDGTHTTSDAAPYLDYTRADPAQQAAAERLLTGGGWLGEDLEAAAFSVAITDAIPKHLARLRARTIDRVGKVRGAVHERLTREINYWDLRANELSAQVQSGKQPKMNPDRARQRADDLAGRVEVPPRWRFGRQRHPRAHRVGAGRHPTPRWHRWSGPGCSPTGSRRHTPSAGSTCSWRISAAPSATPTDRFVPTSRRGRDSRRSVIGVVSERCKERAKRVPSRCVLTTTSEEDDMTQVLGDTTINELEGGEPFTRPGQLKPPRHPSSKVRSGSGPA
jgi:hypothetical protein